MPRQVLKKQQVQQHIESLCVRRQRFASSVLVFKSLQCNSTCKDWSSSKTCKAQTMLTLLLWVAQIAASQLCVVRSVDAMVRTLVAFKSKSDEILKKLRQKLKRKWGVVKLLKKQPVKQQPQQCLEPLALLL